MILIEQDQIVELINGAIVPYTVNVEAPIVKKSIKKMLKTQYTEQEYIEAIDAGVVCYLRYDQDGNLTRESVNKFINKLGGILFNKRLEINDPEWNAYISSLNKKYKKHWDNSKIINELNIHYKSGVSIKSLYRLAIGTDSWTELKDKLQDETLNQILLGAPNE